MKKTLFAMLAMAAALSVSATTIELLKNGEGTTLDGWTVGHDSTAEDSYFFTAEDSWFVTGHNETTLSQMVDLTNPDFGFTPEYIETSPVVTASATVWRKWGSRVCKVTVEEFSLNGNSLGEHTVVSLPTTAIPEESPNTYTTSFNLNPGTRKLCYTLMGRDYKAWAGYYGPKFRNCSLALTRVQIDFTLVSTSATVGSAVYVEGETGPAAPVPTRQGDYTFLGYFTEDGVQVFDASGELVPGSISGLSEDTTLYARWVPPEGSVVKLVYRGQLNLLAGGPAVNDQAYVKRMHFRVYDDAEATTPLWSIDDQDVTVNADGSFVHAFGDDTLAALIATGKVTHVGLAIGPSASLATELKPRRALRPVATVNRALTAEGAALDVRVGSLTTENALVAADATVSELEVAGRVTAPGAGKVEVSPLVIGPEERTRLMRGSGVRVFSRNAPTELGTVPSALRGQVLATAPSDGIALITSSAGGSRALRCPAVVQYCRVGESVRAPTSDAGGLKVTFFPFVGK